MTALRSKFVVDAEVPDESERSTRIIVTPTMIPEIERIVLVLRLVRLLTAIFMLDIGDHTLSGVIIYALSKKIPKSLPNLAQVNFFTENLRALYFLGTI